MKKSNTKKLIKWNKKGNRRERRDDEKKLIKLRRMVRELFFKKGLRKKAIAKMKGVSRNFVIRWTKEERQDITEDGRGWKKGKGRKWGEEVREKIKKIHDRLKGDKKAFYTGATAIEQEWRKEHPKDGIPPLRTMGQILKELGCTQGRKRDRHHGAARYLCYPEHTIYERLGGRVLEADFIGKKYLRGESEPLNFVGFSFKKAPRMRYFKRMRSETGKELIRGCQEFFNRFEKPDYLKLDNGPAMIGSMSGKRTISRAVQYLLKERITPIFSVPRKPFSQASIEGNNSVFARKFWNRREFKNGREVDRQLEWFNDASQRYLEYQSLKEENKKRSKFHPRIYFIRQVKEDEETRKGFIEILNEKVYVRSNYINYFVLAQWRLKSQKLLIYFEKNLKPVLIKKISFKINPKSKDKLKSFLLV